MATYTIENYPNTVGVTVDKETFVSFVKTIAQLRNKDVTITATFKPNGDAVEYLFKGVF